MGKRGGWVDAAGERQGDDEHGVSGDTGMTAMTWWRRGAEVGAGWLGGGRAMTAWWHDLQDSMDDDEED